MLPPTPGIFVVLLGPFWVFYVARFALARWWYHRHHVRALHDPRPKLLGFTHPAGDGEYRQGQPLEIRWLPTRAARLCCDGLYLLPRLATSLWFAAACSADEREVRGMVGVAIVPVFVLVAVGVALVFRRARVVYVREPGAIARWWGAAAIGAVVEGAFLVAMAVTCFRADYPFATGVTSTVLAVVGVVLFALGRAVSSIAAETRGLQRA